MIIKSKTKCPYEIGDKIRFEKGGQVREMKITDIIAEKSVATGRNNIVLELDGWYKLDTKLHEIKTMRRPVNTGWCHYEAHYRR